MTSEYDSLVDCERVGQAKCSGVVYYEFITYDKEVATYYKLLGCSVNSIKWKISSNTCLETHDVAEVFDKWYTKAYQETLYETYDYNTAVRLKQRDDVIVRRILY